MNAIAQSVLDDVARQPVISNAVINQAIQRVCGRIAPNWPLDRSIAVNPWWHWIEKPFAQVATQLEYLGGIRLYMPLSYYRHYWQQGVINREHLLQSIREESQRSGTTLQLEALLSPDEHHEAIVAQPLLSDILDSRRDLSHAPRWRDVITHQISQSCAAYFDHHQSDWRSVNHQGLYAHWREMIAQDHGLGMLMGNGQFIQRVHALPVDARSTIAHIVHKLQVTVAHLEDVLLNALLRINGWASWCAYLRWQARLQGSDDDQIVELLAIRLSWEWLLDDERRDEGSAWHQWQLSRTPTDKPHQRIWQRAMELAYQQQLAAHLHANNLQPSSFAPAIQAVFCIDVRSEPLRRALETADDGIETMGFAGFFGIPLAYTPLGTDLQRPQLPGLLAPAINISETCGDAVQDSSIQLQRRERLMKQQVWKRFTRMPSSAFTLVESLGIGYLKKLVTRGIVNADHAESLEHTGLTHQQHACLSPALLLHGDDIEARATLAQRIVKAMSFTHFARLILLAGHGAQSSNNPQAAALACGACGGQSGDVNARVLAALLNDHSVRAALAERGMTIPASTCFIAGLHNTTTSEVTLFDTARLPDTHQRDLERLKAALDNAGQIVRSELAPSLGLSSLVNQPVKLQRALRARARDWSQLRPEWGLANNAAFIVAPRTVTRGINLSGRVFLHDYDWQADTDGAVLELIMTAPMIVTHWINMQYYASTVDNQHCGSGNKILHNVVGGHIGVFEGNGGDLRFGLSMQSVHDGQNWMHQPLRLNVFIAAPRDRIERIVRQHDNVRHLIDNDWLYLFRISDDKQERRIERLFQGQWSEFG